MNFCFFAEVADGGRAEARKNALHTGPGEVDRPAS